jgi:hypothetical protein
MAETERWREGSELMIMRRSILLMMFSLQAVFIMKAEDRAYKEAISLYDEIGTLKGQVLVTNNPELGRTPASGQYFLLQRVDCRKCVIGVCADINGYYVAFLAPGKYRLIPLYDSQGTTDLIRNGQSREVTIHQGAKDTEFNIELEIPRQK